MNTESDFYKVLTKVDKLEMQLRKEVDFTKMLYEMDMFETVYPYSLKVEEIAEKMVLLTRALPCYTGHPRANKDIEKVLEKTIPVEIGFTDKGWFSIRIPALLPRKEHGGVDYIRAFLFPAMCRYFKDKPIVRYNDCVLIYRHVYNITRPERHRRDHDNIEINMVSDIVAMYVMPDDGPSICDHYYCSAVGTADRTEVYVVPKGEFPDWLAIKNNMPDEGIKLSNNIPTQE